MKNMNLCLVLLISFLSIVSSQELYKKVIPNIDPDAKCIDGSPAGLYVHQGLQKGKILIYLLGGGTCVEKTYSDSIQTCYQRSKTKFGSSNLWPETYSGQGYLSTDPTKNMFAHWTKVLFLYCDGMLHQGNTIKPYIYKQTPLYFRGSVNTRQNFRWVDQQYNLTGATDIILAGASAGAIGSFLWTNYLRSMLQNPSKLNTIIDSGLFVNISSYIDQDYRVSIGAQMVYKIANVDQKTPLQLCNLKYIGQQWKCFFFDIAFTAVDGRMLSIDSQYDIWQIVWNAQMSCTNPGVQQYQFNDCSSNEMAYIQSVRAQRKKFYENFIKFSKNSIWSISCSNHVYASINKYFDSPKQNVPAYSGNTLKNAIQRFVIQKQRVTYIDNVVWPLNHPCAF